MHESQSQPHPELLPQHTLQQWEEVCTQMCPPRTQLGVVSPWKLSAGVRVPKRQSSPGRLPRGGGLQMGLLVPQWVEIREKVGVESSQGNCDKTRP